MTILQKFKTLQSSLLKDPTIVIWRVLEEGWYINLWQNPEIHSLHISPLL